MRTRVLLLVLLAVGLSPISAGPVAAASRAPWVVADSSATPSAMCTYRGGSVLRRTFVPVRMPHIYWPNTHAGRVDSGIVGWRIELQVSEPGHPWHVGYRSSITRGRATEVRAAHVPKLAVNWRLIAPVRAAYRVRLIAIWYRPGGGILMTSSHLMRWYRLARALHPWGEGSPGGWSIGGSLGLRHLSCPNLLGR